MTFLPVVGRELLTAARHAFTYYLRVLGAAAALVASLLFAMDYGFGTNLGAQLFAYLHSTLFGAIWLFVPLLTADCISRERRDGTLGLLFLTRLRADDIVVAKSLAQGLRALTLWLAILPVVTIPILLGGVGWTEAGFSVLATFSAICFALAAGLLASAWNKLWLRSLLTALLLAFLGLLTLGLLVGELILAGVAQSNISFGLPQRSFGFALAFGLYFLTHPVNDALSARLLTPGMSKAILFAMGQVAAASLLMLAAAVILAGQQTRRAWQEAPPSRLQRWWERTFCTPVIGVAFFHRWLRRKLLRNPIGWLEQRTWSGRLVTWGWLAVVISIYSALLSDRNFFNGYSGLQRAMAWLMVVSVGLSAAGSFRRERESGVMELLLVSPLGEAEIIWGRLRGLWGQFLPAFVLLLGIWAYFLSVPYMRFRATESDGEAIFFFAACYLTLPIIGLYFSLQCRNYIMGVLCTLGAGLFLPLTAPMLLGWLVWFLSTATTPMLAPEHLDIWAGLLQFVLALVCWSRLVHCLKRRAFPLENSDTR
jgi:ABC-type transport system involved in multi-copper enzyme maturation permease subunit